MAKVVTVPDAAASQTEHPWRATVRTFLQAAVLAFPLMLALPEVLAVVDQELGAFLPENVRGWLAGAAAVISAGAAAVARVMAIPTVEALLRQVGLGAAPSEVGAGRE